MLVVALDVLHIPGAQEVRERLEFNICGVACVVQCGLDLGQKVMVSCAVLGQAGESLLFQKLLFALEVQLRELYQSIKLVPNLSAIFAVDEHHAQFVQRIHQDAVLVVDGRDANAAFVAPGEKCHRDFLGTLQSVSPWRQIEMPLSWVGKWNFGPITCDCLLEDDIGLRFVPAGGQDDRRTQDQASTEPRMRPQMFAEEFDAEP